jgi:hypothetical protein
MKPWAYMAAMFVGAAMLIRIGSSSNEPTITNQLALDDNELEMEYISTIVDGAMMDDYSLYMFLSDMNEENY